MRFTFPTLANQYLLPATHYLFPSAPNVHTFSTQTTGTVMQVYFHDGSHLPFSPLMSLALLSNDSQHIPLAAICLSAFTANQTSEQPYSLMSGGLESAPACLSAPPHPVCPPPLPLFSIPSLHVHLPTSNRNNFYSALFRPPASCGWFCFYCILFLSLLPSQVSSSPPSSPFLPFPFLLGWRSDMFACSCEGVTDVCVAHRGRGSSRAWREHTLWELPFRTTFSNEQQAGWKTQTQVPPGSHIYKDKQKFCSSYEVDKMTFIFFQPDKNNNIDWTSSCKQLLRDCPLHCTSINFV